MEAFFMKSVHEPKINVYMLVAHFCANELPT